MMWPKTIKSKAEYDRALNEIELVFDAKPGTDDFDRLELLTMLIKDYEGKNYQIAPPTPIEAIRFAMESQGLNTTDLVTYFGSRSAMSQVLGGKRPLTLGMIRALHKGLGIPAETLIRDAGTVIPEEIAGVDFKRFPLTWMVKRGWLPAVADLKARAEELVRDFAASAGDTVYGHAGCFRQGARQNAKDDRYAVEAWRLGARIEADKFIISSQFQPSCLTPNLLTSVAKLSAQGDESPLHARDQLAALGIKLIHVPHLPRTYLDGGVFYLAEGPVIALTLRHDRIDYFWFTLMHDLAHLVLGHVHPEEGECLIEDLDMISVDERECEADRLAQNSMILPEVWTAHPVSQKTNPSPLEVFDLATKAGVHPAIVAGRVRYEHKNFRILSSLIGQGKVRKLFSAA